MSFSMSSNPTGLKRPNADDSSGMKLRQLFCNFDSGFSTLSQLLFVCWHRQDSNYAQKTSGRKRLAKLVAALHKHTASLAWPNKILMAVLFLAIKKKLTLLILENQEER